MDFLRNALPLTILPDLVDAIMAAPNTLRKQLITLARYGDFPQGTGAFFRRTTDAVDLIMTLFGSIKRLWDNEAWDIRGNVVDASLSLLTQSKAPKLTPP
jgi:hypothetical protein